MISTYLPGLDEVITAHKNGLILPEDDFEGVCRQLKNLVENDAALDQLRINARKTDLSDWQLENLGRQTTQLYGRPVLQGAGARVFAS